MCVCSSIVADAAWRGGWVLGNTNVLRTDNNTLYLRTAPYSSVVNIRFGLVKE